LHRRVRDLAITEERERIAREMHDSLAQVLGYVNTKAQAVQELLKSGQVERAEQQVGQLGEAARSAYADVREGILGLRTSLGPQHSLLDALEEYLDRWREQSGVEAQLIVEPAGGKLDGLGPSAELQLLRIVQEALANVRKHAAATSVRVRITESLEAVETAIEDDGRGFEPGHGRVGEDAVPHFGLATMRERAESVGGHLEIQSAPGEGTRVLVRVPVGSASRRRPAPAA
jgi:signal transduction histidine kinase